MRNNMNKIKIIIRKEWAEVFKNKMVIFSVIFLPLMMTAIPLGILYFSQDAGMTDFSSDMPSEFLRFCPQGLSGGECFQVYMVSQFMLMFMMIPLIIPVSIASYSIVGEKTNRSLEPLLATPITTTELLTGKNMAAAIPAILATWAGFAIYAIGTILISQSPGVTRAILDAKWLGAIFIVSPLMAVLSVNFSIMVSSRVTDVRAAEQLSAVVIIPLLALFFAQVAGVIFINSLIVALMAVALAIADAIFIYLAVRLFQRETILTRWK
jgi:ABC-2 type transport system permease protein